ncbi:MAG TPA: GNAT family N-acetyltransferase [Candidatus Dormibacteraeota bacterium]|nr:GNAT family N-acetyltransferase [Candidatus Dormibacteraeota bacterium]
MNRPGDPPSLRRATLADIPALGDLLEAVGTEGRWIATEPPLDRRRFAFHIRSFIERESHLCLVVPGEDGSLLGELTAWPEEPRSATIGMCVAARSRRAGIGTALLLASIDWARERSLERLELKVFPHNDAARALYVKMGFVQTGIERASIRRRNGERWDAVMMALEL